MRLRATGKRLRAANGRRTPLLSAGLHGRNQGRYQRESRRSEDLHQPRRALEPFAPYPDSADDAANEWFLPQVEQSPRGHRALSRLVQLLPDSRLS